MHRLETTDLRRPFRLLRTRAPWTSLLYLAVQALAGAVSIGVWLSVLLIPVWLMLWPRCEQRLLPLAGRVAPTHRRERWELRWQDVVLVLLTSVMAVAAFFLGILLVVLLGTLLAVPFAAAAGREITSWSGDRTLPIVPTAVIAPLLGLFLLFLVLWGVTALAHGWSALSAALLRDDERRLAAQVDALSAETVRIGDSIALERQALERDLHDGAQMHFSAAGMRLALLHLDLEELSVSAAERTRLLTGITDVQRQLDLGSQAMRDATRGLVPSALRDGGLCGALEELVTSIPLPVTLECSVPRQAPALEQSVLLIARESLTNVVRHSEATRADVRCVVEDARLLLEVRDDGTGGAEPTGTGLLSMHARARRLGGTLSLTSPAGHGTCLLLDVPRQMDEDAAA
ncbi:MAG TPA: hypothetical protein H9837_07470 [Candidatus Brachybacterium merdigallinarum]|nr:hypothetical protein [Candidatus Brachybacterium merdigallinarum]